MLAGGGNGTSWQNLQRLAAGQEIEVTKTDGKPVRGAFIGFADQSISVRQNESRAKSSTSSWVS